MDNKEICEEKLLNSDENVMNTSDNTPTTNPSDINDELNKEDLSSSDFKLSTQEYKAEETGGDVTEKQLILNMQAQINELTEEVKKLRVQADMYNNTVATEENISKSTHKNKPKKKKGALFGEILFYSMLVLLVLVAFFIRSNSNGKPNSIAGFSAFTVLTSSMEREIPKGSLVITQSVDPNTLKIGDDITYMSGPTSTITHRIIGITENYLDTGQRGFETQGIMNADPDKEIVASANVVGKVIFHNKFLGDISTYVTKNWPIVVFVFVVIIVLFIVLKKVLNDDSESKDKSKQKEIESENLKNVE